MTSARLPKPVRIIALDTSGARAAVAVCKIGERVTYLASQDRAMERGQAEALLPMVRDVMAQAGTDWSDIDRVAAVCGPGSFTGMRIAISAARGLALAAGCPAVGISALDALCHGINGTRSDPLAIAQDARRGQIYLAIYGPDCANIQPPAVRDLSDIASSFPASVHAVAGSGAHLLRDAIQLSGRTIEILDENGHPDMAVVCQLAADADPDHLPPTPLYLRPPDAKPQTRHLVRR